MFADRFWVNPFDSEMRARSKPLQLEMARAAGLDVPRTVVTNCPEEVDAFVQGCSGRALYKTFEPFSVEYSPGRWKGVYATVLAKATLERRLGSVRLAPCLIQDYVEKREEFRVTVIGQAVFAARVVDRDGEPFDGDFRRSGTGVQCERAQLPADVVSRILTLLTRMGLVFGCIDMIRTPDDRFVFLEVNSSGQWYWIELMTGLPLLKTFAGMLMSGRAHTVG